MDETAPMGSAANEPQLLGEDKPEPGATPPRPGVPRILRIYGGCIAAVNILGIIGVVINCLNNFDRVGSNVLVGGFVIAFILYLLFKLGMGLYNGERQAVIGLCVFGVLSLPLTIVQFIGAPDLGISRSAYTGFVSLAIVSVLYVTPIVIALRHWESFK